MLTRKTHSKQKNLAGLWLGSSGDDAQLAPDLGEGCDGRLQVRLRVRRRELHADARLPLWYHLQPACEVLSKGLDPCAQPARSCAPAHLQVNLVSPVADTADA